MSLEINELQNLIDIKRAAKKTFELFEAGNATIVEDTIRYRRLSLNTRSGLLKYGQILIRKLYRENGEPPLTLFVIRAKSEVSILK